MKTILRGSLALSLLLLIAASGFAQFPEDALRYSTPGLTLGARSLGMGATWTGTANDFSAMFTNPAGLGQVRTSEISMGLSNLSVDNSSTFFNKSSSLSNSSTSLNNLGFVYPFPTVRGSMVFAAGYNRNSDFTTSLSFNGFNPGSSIIPTLNYDLAYQLYLIDSTGNTPLLDSMQQQGRVIEGGGVKDWTIAGAIEAARQLYIGLSLTFVSGSYSYNRDFTETDINNKYSVSRFGSDYALTRFMMTNTINADIGGFTAKVGMIYKPTPAARVGFSVKIPTYYTIQETFSSDGVSTFDVPDTRGVSEYGYYLDGRTEYDVHTPFVFNAGFSYLLGNLMLAGDVDYTDWTQMSFANADPSVEAYNTDMKELFRATANLRAGAEFEFPGTGLRLRAGYAYLPSPYKGDPSDYAQKYITGGIGFIVENAVAFDLGYARGTFNTIHTNYDASSVTREKMTTNTLIGTVSYRF